MLSVISKLLDWDTYYLPSAITCQAIAVCHHSSVLSVFSPCCCSQSLFRQSLFIFNILPLQKWSRYRVLSEIRLVGDGPYPPSQESEPNQPPLFGVCDHITSVHMRDFFLSQFPRFVFRFMHFTLKKIFVNKKKSAQSDLGKVP